MPWITKHSTEQYQPEVPPERTKAQKISNWLDYHVLLLVAIAAALVIGWMIMRDRARVEAVDQHVGYVGSETLSDQTIAALEKELAHFASDINGDGEVTVELVPYYVDFGWEAEGNLARADNQAAYTRLGADIGTGTGPYVFFIADPVRFEDVTRALCYTDGSQEDNPAEAEIRWQDTVFAVDGCPALADLDALLPDGMYIGRRGVWDETHWENFAGSIDFWQALTENAVALE